MKAIICEKYGPPSSLKLLEVDDPVIGENELLIQVKACSINFPDTLIIQGMYQFKGEPPFSPGSNVAGIVLEVGSEVSDFKAGDEVIGMMTHGGLAEKCVVKPNQCIAKPANMSMESAAAFLYTYATSYHALKDRANLQAGETVLVLGASGGVGLAAVELAKMMGAKVIAAASTEEKLTLCKERGADMLINYSDVDLKKELKALTGGKGVDVILDPVGGAYAEPSLRAIAWKGRYLVVGFTTGEIPKFPLNLALLKGCQIIGVFLGAYTMIEPVASGQMMQHLAEKFNEGVLNPYIYKTYSLAEAPDALDLMMNRGALGKLIVNI